jgi:signal transduction histidine kinase
MAFSLFVKTLYPNELGRPIVALALGTCYTLFVLVTPAIVYTQTMLAFQFLSLLMFAHMILVFIKATARRREGSAINLVAMLLFFVSVLNEALYYNHVHLLPFGGTISIGLYLYLFAQAIIISMRFSKAFTDTEKLSAALASLNASLEQQVKDRTTDLERMDRSRRMLLSNISHELRTPLTSILGYVKGIIDGIFPSNDSKYPIIIYEKGLLLNRIIQDLSELSLLETRQAEFHFQKVKIISYMTRLYEKYAHDIEVSGLHFEFVQTSCRLPSDSVIASIDAGRIEQAVSNLLMNAKKFTPDGGTVTLRMDVKEMDKQLVVSIKDTGVGIDEADIPQLFERFYRGKSHRKDSGGTGLGLVIAKEIIELHKGRIYVESKLGVGSTFYVLLPVEFVVNDSMMHGGAEDDGRKNISCRG